MEDEDQEVNSDSSDEDLLTYDIITYHETRYSQPNTPSGDTVSEPENTDMDLPSETFNEDLPPEHSYLGENLESVSGRVILTEGSYVTLPLLPRAYGTLVPGQTFPMTVRDYGRAYMFRKCVETNHTFGCISNRYRDHVGRGAGQGIGQGVGSYGTTAEIYEFSDDIGTVCIKAKARQRFKLIKTKRNDGGFLTGELKILPEVNLNKPLSSIQCSSLNRLRTTQKERCFSWESYLTPWPKWVYDQYDIDKLKARVDKELIFLKQGLRKDKGKMIMPNDPSELSFWLATHLDAEERYHVIKLDSPIQRLRWQLSLMSKCQQYYCFGCQTQIGQQSDVFAMSIEGAQSIYVNPDGYLHDTMTLINATNLVLVSTPSTDYSWFPGYAWSIAVCANCHKHIGWQFIAQKPRLQPHKFYGLSRSSLITKISMDAQQDEVPVM